MADSIHYLKTLTEYLSGTNMFYSYTERLKTILVVMGDPHHLTDILDSEHEQIIQRVKAFMSALYGVFPKDRVFELCQLIIDYQTGLDGKETLFYLEAALLEVRRYFFRHQKQITELMHCCEFPYEQHNEEILPLASMVLCSYEPPYMRPAKLFPGGYGDLRLPFQLPVDPAFIEPESKSDILKYVAPEIREGLLAHGQKDFFSKYADFFSTLFADSVLFLHTFTTIPNDIQNREGIQKDLLKYLGELCRAANIEPDIWVDAKLLNTWLTRDGYDQLKRGMKQYGVIENVLTRDREDIPDWETRFHAEKVQFRYWKPLVRGFIRMGVNSVSEYQSIAVLEKAVIKENKQSAAPSQIDTYIGLLQKMRGITENRHFEAFMQENDNLSLFADIESDIRTKKIAEDTYFYTYYNKVCGGFLKAGRYRILIPPVGKGDTFASGVLEGELPVRAVPVFEPGEKPVACQIEKTNVQSLEAGVIKVKAAFPGLMRGQEVLAVPFISVEIPVTPKDKLEELAESLDNIIHELRTERDILGARRYINSFIHSMRIIEQLSKSGTLETRQKIDWLNQNHFIYNLFNFSPQEGFNNLTSVIRRYEDALKNRIQINGYQESFYTAWGLCVRRLNSMGVRETPITINKTRVTKRELLDGWNKENTENRKADENHPPDLVYGIIKKGIEIDGHLVQKPVVNVYS